MISGKVVTTMNSEELQKTELFLIERHIENTCKANNKVFVQLTVITVKKDKNEKSLWMPDEYIKPLLKTKTKSQPNREHFIGLVAEQLGKSGGEAWCFSLPTQNAEGRIPVDNYAAEQ